MPSATSIEARIEEAFAPYGSTIELVETLFAERRNPVELVLLVCSRLDALSNLASTKGPANDRFAQFVITYGDRAPDLERISVGDLYAYLGREYHGLPGTLATRGRLELFTTVSLPFLRFLANSGLPLTEEAVGAFMRRCSVGIQRRFRTTATQSRSKPALASLNEVVDHLEAELRRSRWKGYTDTVLPPFRSLARLFSVAQLLYREVRSGAIHEHGFGVDERRFFSEGEPYVDTWQAVDYDDTRYLALFLPGRWLIDLLRAASRATGPASCGRSNSQPISLRRSVSSPTNSSTWTRAQYPMSGSSGPTSADSSGTTSPVCSVDQVAKVSRW